MRPAPVRRIAAVCGLLALVPVAILLYTDVLTPVEAAVRASAILAVVMMLTRLASWGLMQVLQAVERHEAARRAMRAAENRVDERGGA